MENLMEDEPLFRTSTGREDIERRPFLQRVQIDSGLLEHRYSYANGSSPSLAKVGGAPGIFLGLRIAGSGFPRLCSSNIRIGHPMPLPDFGKVLAVLGHVQLMPLDLFRVPLARLFRARRHARH